MVPFKYRCFTTWASWCTKSPHPNLPLFMTWSRFWLVLAPGKPSAVNSGQIVSFGLKCQGYTGIPLEMPVAVQNPRPDFMQNGRFWPKMPFWAQFSRNSAAFGGKGRSGAQRSQKCPFSGQMALWAISRVSAKKRLCSSRRRVTNQTCPQILQGIGKLWTKALNQDFQGRVHQFGYNHDQRMLGAACGVGCPWMAS